MEKSKEIAAEIMKQMGGSGRLQAMIGANTFICGDDGWVSDKTSPYMRFNFKSNAKNKSKQFVVILDEASDTYNIEWWKQVRSNQYDKFQADPLSFRVKRMEGIYCDRLIEIFETETGLYLSL